MRKFTVELVFLFLFLYPIMLSKPASAQGAAETPAAARLQQGPLSLQDCIDIALANNPDIAASTWEVYAAEASRDEAAAQRWPGTDGPVDSGGLDVPRHDRRRGPTAFRTNRRHALEPE